VLLSSIEFLSWQERGQENMESFDVLGVVFIGGVCILSAFVLVAAIAFIIANQRNS
jgi:hypothetical protein